EVAAGVLDVAHHAWGGVDRAFLPHEADAARLVHLHRLREGEARLEGFLHRGLLPRRAAMRSPSEARSAPSRASRADGSTAAPSRSMCRRYGHAQRVTS